MSDRPDQPTPPPDPWARQTPPGEPGAPSWAGPWSAPRPPQQDQPEQPTRPTQPVQPDGEDGWRAGGDGWRAGHDQRQRLDRPPGPPGTPGTPGPWQGERLPVPPPPASPRVLWLELGLVLLLAFAPGVLGLLIIALGNSADTSASGQLLPAIVSGLFSAFLSWSPVLLIGYLLIRSGEGRQGIGLGQFQGRADGLGGLGLWIASFVLVLILARVFAPLGQREVDFLPPQLPLWFRWIDALVIATTAGVTEEVVVRGYAQTRLEQLKMPTGVVLVLPTALWGVLHLYEGASAALTIFCLGMLYAWYFHRTRRLWPIVIAHGMFDLTQLVLLLSTSAR